MARPVSEAAGFHEHLTKPISLDRLLDALTRVAGSTLTPQYGGLTGFPPSFGLTQGHHPSGDCGDRPLPHEFPGGHPLMKVSRSLLTRSFSVVQMP
jgi:hypothetical protein